jgi:hypothetical protein
MQQFPENFGTVAECDRLPWYFSDHNAGFASACGRAARCGYGVTGVRDMDVQVNVPSRHQGITTRSDALERVAPNGTVADLRSPCTVDVDRPSVLFALTMLDWRRIAHIAQPT